MLIAPRMAGGGNQALASKLPKNQRDSSSSRPAGSPADGGSFTTHESPEGHERGPADTGWEVGKRERTPRFWRLLVASLVFHAFLTPIPALLGIVAMLPALNLEGGEELVEVDLTALPMGPVAPQPEDEPPRPAEPAVAPPAEDVPPPDSKDPGDDPQPPAEPADEPRDATPESEAPVAPTETKEFGDPVALAGEAGQIADSNANVRLFLFNDVVRDHPLGDRVGQLLRRTPQWRDFFGPSGIDPVRDIDRVLIAGPQLRNSSQVVAVVQHALGKERIEAAFNVLVSRKGDWIDRDKLVARARADRADRIFAAPNERVVVVAPPNMEGQVRALGEKTGFPPSAGDVAVTAYVVTPANVAKGTGIQIPKTIKWARFDLRPLADGGAVLKILAEDIDEEHARNHATLFQTLIEQVSTMDPRQMGGLGALASMLGVQKQKFIESVEFSSEKERIHGTLRVTKNQLLFAADLLEGFLPPDPAAAPSIRDVEPGLDGSVRPAPVRAPTPSAPPDTSPPGGSEQSPSSAPAASP